MVDFTLSKHAIDRILDMAVEPAEIRDAYDRPRNEHQSGKTGAVYLTRGRVTLVCNLAAEPPIVITVMWANPNAWALDSGRGEFGESGSDMASSREAYKARRRKKGDVS